MFCEDYVPRRLSHNAVRKIRVEKAVEHGAECMKEWSEDGMYLWVPQYPVLQAD